MENENNLQNIAECLAAMDTMRQLICGMFGAIQEKQELHSSAVKAFNDSEKKLQTLVEKLPNDAITLGGIRDAAGAVKSTVDSVPGLIATEMNTVGQGVAAIFINATKDHVADIQSAAAAATSAAAVYKGAAALAQWKTTGVAVFASVLSVGVAVAGFWFWLPSYKDLQAMRLERDEMAATVAKLDRAGGRASIVDCGGRLCAAIEESSLSAVWRNPETGGVAIILKGY